MKAAADAVNLELFGNPVVVPVRVNVAGDADKVLPFTGTTDMPVREKVPVEAVNFGARPTGLLNKRSSDTLLYCVVHSAVTIHWLVVGFCVASV